MLFLVIPSFISMTAEGEHQSSHSLEFLAKVVNFIVLFGGLGYLLRKPLRSFLENRSRQIEQAIKEAKHLREKAETDLEKTRGRLGSLEEDARQIKEEAAFEGESAKRKIIQLASEEAERLQKLTGQEIERLAQSSFQELKRYTIEQAVSKARMRIKRKITQEKHKLLIDESIEKLYEKSISG